MPMLSACATPASPTDVPSLRRGGSLGLAALLLVFLLADPGESCAQVSAQDSLALVALYQATGGPAWHNAEGWLTGPVASWHGVTVEENRVTQLQLFDNQLTGTIPTELGRLTNLNELLLNGNQLTGSIPTALGRLTNLYALYLDGNQLTGSIPAELGRLTNLVDLRLWNNQLTGAIPTELGNLTNLIVLFLNSNQLTGRIPPELGRLSDLQSLELQNNQLTGAIPTGLGRLSNLQGVNLSNNAGLCKPPSATGWAIIDQHNTVPDCAVAGPAASVVPSRAERVPSQGADTEVLNFTLTNDLDVPINVTWIDGEGGSLPTNPDQPWIWPGEAFRVADGAKTYQSHWFAIHTERNFLCSFSPREGVVVRLSELSECR